MIGFSLAINNLDVFSSSRHRNSVSNFSDYQGNEFADYTRSIDMPIMCLQAGSFLDIHIWAVSCHSANLMTAGGAEHLFFRLLQLQLLVKPAQVLLVLIQTLPGHAD